MPIASSTNLRERLIALLRSRHECDATRDRRRVGDDDQQSTDRPHREHIAPSGLSLDAPIESWAGGLESEWRRARADRGSGAQRASIGPRRSWGSCGVGLSAPVVLCGAPDRGGWGQAGAGRRRRRASSAVLNCFFHGHRVGSRRVGVPARLTSRPGSAM